MTGPAARPLVFLDVDGPLIPFRARPGRNRYIPMSLAGQVNDDSDNPLLDRLDPANGHSLLELGCELVWATTWMAEANEVVSPRLGLRDLPVVEFPDTDDEPVGGLHWKTMFLIRWAAGRPFVWIDDECTEADRRWVARHHPGRALVHRVDPFVGLTNTDFDSIHRWLARLPET
jgi:hypothetical protein